MQEILPSRADNPPHPPWRSDFLQDIALMAEPTGSLATVSPATDSPAMPARPHVRTVMFRGMLAELCVHPSNPASPNPRAFESCLPTITTDARTEKVAQLFPAEPAAATMVGGPAELVLWSEPRKAQWRLAGTAYLLGPDVESEAAAPVRKALEAEMQPVGADDEVRRWSWRREVTAHFGNMGPANRGWFRYPPPGKPVSEPVSDDRLGLGQMVHDLEDEVARRNFRVLVMVPDVVDKVELWYPPQPRRWRYVRLDGGEWQTTEIWP